MNTPPESLVKQIRGRGMVEVQIRVDDTANHAFWMEIELDMQQLAKILDTMQPQ